MTTFIVISLIAAAAYFYLRGKSRQGGELSGSLPGPGTYAFDIVGESNYQKTLEEICGGKTENGVKHLTEATLVLEDSNKFDNMAVRVDIHGQTVGYLSKKDARSYRKQLMALGHPDITCVCKATIVGGWDRAGGDTGHFGVKLDLPVA